MENLINVLITDTNVELYNTSVPMWAEYGITSHRVDNIEQALIVLSKKEYDLVVVVENRTMRAEVLKCIACLQGFTDAPLVIASTDEIDPEYRVYAFDIGADEVWEMPKSIREAVAKGNALIRLNQKSKKKMPPNADCQQANNPSN